MVVFLFKIYQCSGVDKITFLNFPQFFVFRMFKDSAVLCRIDNELICECVCAIFDVFFFITRKLVLIFCTLSLQFWQKERDRNTVDKKVNNI